MRAARMAWKDGSASLRPMTFGKQYLPDRGSLYWSLPPVNLRLLSI